MTDMNEVAQELRAFVGLLVRHGFEVSSSGPGDEENVLPWPFVFITIERPEDLIAEAERLHRVMRDAGIDVEAGDIQATFDPAQARVGVIGLIDDEDRYIRRFRCSVN